MRLIVKKIGFILSFLIIICLIQGFTFHPYYVTVTEIEHNKKIKTLEISCKIFTDDFEKALRLQDTHTTIDLLNSIDKTKMDKLVSDYVRKHLQITINGKRMQLQFLGYESEGEAILSYFQVKDITKITKIDVKDELLYEYKKEQINLLHITVNGKRKSTKLNNPESRVSFGW